MCTEGDGFGTPDLSIRLNPITRDWGEGSFTFPLGLSPFSAPASAGEATWNSAESGVAWASAGAHNTNTDRVDTVLGTISAAGTGTVVVPLNADGVALVQGWVDGTIDNHGLILDDGAASDGLDFKSSTYQWLVIAGNRAQFKGTGTIQGVAGTYGFFLTAIDGQLTGGDGLDKFRIKIWDVVDDTIIIYDNELAEDLDDADPTTPIASGSIVIHKKGGKK